MNEIVLGIDLGTTFSAMAWVNDTGQVEVIPNREDKNITPSVVLLEPNGRFVVGQDAQFQAAARPNDVVQWMKRDIGSDIKYQGVYTPEQLSAEVLRKLKSDAEEYLQRSIQRAVITIPAYFDALPMERTKEAGEMAGFQVQSLLHEPEAAAIFFGIDHLSNDESVLVCDLGGGTYDATVLLMEDGVLKAVSTSGARELGGHDWTQAMVEMVAPQIARETGVNPESDPSQWQRLYDLCEQAKKELSQVATTTIPWSIQGGSLSLPMTAEEYETRCESLINQVVNKTAEAVESSPFKMSQIKHLLLVGGSSRLPRFAAVLEELTGVKARRTRNPDEAIARGAALVAHGYARDEVSAKRGRIVISAGGAGGRISVQRSTSFALGTMGYREGDNGFELAYKTIIPAATPIPARQSHNNFSIPPGQSTFQIPVLQFTGSDGPYKELANYRFSGAPSRTHEAAVEVCFEYDSLGLPRVSAIDVESGEQLLGDRCPFQPPDLSKLSRVSNEPSTVVLAVDCSGSMFGSKLQEAKRVMSELASKYVDLGGNWSIGLVNFGGTHSIYPSEILMHPTNSIAKIRESSNRLECGGGTPMAAGLANIRKILESVPGKRLAIVLTDGFPNDPAESRQTAQTLKALGIRIGTVPIGSDADRGFLRMIGDLESDISVDNSGNNLAEAVLDLLKMV